MDGYGEFVDIAESCTGRKDFGKFKDACREYVLCRIGEVSEDQFDTVFDYSWDRGHSSGYLEVALVFGELLDVVIVFARARKCG